MTNKSRSTENKKCSVHGFPFLPQPHHASEYFSFEVIGDTQRVGDDGQRWINRAGRHHETAIGHIHVVEVMRLAVHIQHARPGVMTESHSATLMGKIERVLPA